MGLICPFTATGLPTRDDCGLEPGVCPLDPDSIGAAFCMYLVEVSGESVQGRQGHFIFKQKTFPSGATVASQKWPVVSQLFACSVLTQGLYTEATRWYAGQT